MRSLAAHTAQNTARSLNEAFFALIFFLQFLACDLPVRSVQSDAP